MRSICTDSFYAGLPVLDDFLDVADSTKFTSVPQDWYVLITDIVDSTPAIAAGRYRDINLLGASSIAAVLNITGKLEIPFVFGGDGATLLVPPSLLQRSRQALLATQQLAQERFGLVLRAAIIPVQAIVTAQYEIKVAKIRVSDHYNQALFTGGGLTYAAHLLKSKARNLYQLYAKAPISEADYTGLECRWKDIYSPLGQIITLIVMATASGGKQNDQVFRNVLEKITTVYGETKNFHPVSNQRLDLTFNYKKLISEVKLRAKSNCFWHQQLYLLRISIENLLGLLLMKFKVKTKDVNWEHYKDGVTAATDYKKFDDVLRMVIASTKPQAEELIEYLEQRSKAGELVYGSHISDRALMTCLVFERNGRQVHFIDGADGGYTFAAEVLKEKMHQKALNWKTYMKMLRLRIRRTEV